MMKMPMKMEKKITTLTTHHDAQYAPHAMSYASPCFLAYAPYYALCSMPHASLSIPPMPVFPALFVVPPSLFAIGDDCISCRLWMSCTKQVWYSEHGR